MIYRPGSFYELAGSTVEHWASPDRQATPAPSLRFISSQGDYPWIEIELKVPLSRQRARSNKPFGKVTGDAKTEAEGKADMAKGKVQNTDGGIKDKAREVLDDK